MNIIDKKIFNEEFKKTLDNSTFVKNEKIDLLLEELVSKPIKSILNDERLDIPEFFDDAVARCYELSEDSERDTRELKSRIYYIVKNNKKVGFGGVF